MGGEGETMKAIRIFVLASLMTAAVVAGPAGKAAPSRGEAPRAVTLAGKNTIVGSKGSVVDVRITTPAVWTGSTDEVKVEGGGVTSGFVLTRLATSVFEHPILGRIETKFEEFVVSATRLPAKGPLKNLSAQQRTMLLTPMKTTLDPGLYRLYLIADGAPVKVRLELQGLLGSKRISPSTPTGLDTKKLFERTDLTTPAAALVTSGDDAVLERTGLIFNALAVELKDSPEGEFGSCIYQGGPVNEEEGEVVSYGPYCAGAAGRDHTQTVIGYAFVGAGKRIGISYGMVAPMEKETWTISNWYRGTGVTGEAAGFGYWLNLK